MGHNMHYNFQLNRGGCCFRGSGLSPQSTVFEKAEGEYV